MSAPEDKDAPNMPATTRSSLALQRTVLPVSQLEPNSFSLSIYGDPAVEIDDLLPSIREHGVLVALVVAAGPLPGVWEVISGHRRLACAQALGLTKIPCEVHYMPDGLERCRSILEYNRQRRKTFSQLMPLRKCGNRKQARGVLVTCDGDK
jgi:ParB family transcriptional regulator, chromosome partitioning protein